MFHIGFIAPVLHRGRMELSQFELKM